MLYLVPTPIGNLGDMTIRALETLKKVDFIYAEDTRRTRKLLHYFEIDAKVRSYYEHNKDKAGADILDLLREGKDIALVSDAGMPCISDPGLVLVRQCIEHSLDFTVLPGATAFATAFAGSGITADVVVGGFCFMGFPPKTTKHKKQSFSAIADDPRPHIFYESPHALRETLSSMREVLGCRRICLARELTKIHEEYIRGDIDEVLLHFETAVPRGEFVIVVEGAREEERVKSEDARVRTKAEPWNANEGEREAAKYAEAEEDSEEGEGAKTEKPKTKKLWKANKCADIDVDKTIRQMSAEGFGAKEIAESISKMTGERKKTIYNRVLQLKPRDS